MLQVLSMHETIASYRSVSYIGTILPIVLILLGYVIKPARPVRSKVRKDQWECDIETTFSSHLTVWNEILRMAEQSTAFRSFFTLLLYKICNTCFDLRNCLTLVLISETVQLWFKFNLIWSFMGLFYLNYLPRPCRSAYHFLINLATYLK